jgi:hypothetical protein
LTGIALAAEVALLASSERIVGNSDKGMGPLVGRYREVGIAPLIRWASLPQNALSSLLAVGQPGLELTGERRPVEGPRTMASTGANTPETMFPAVLDGGPAI